MSENKVNLPEGQREGALGQVVAVRSIEIVTAEICTIRDNVARVVMEGVVQIGRRLEEAKQLVPQGEWLHYLETQLGYKPSTAQNYMRIAREFGDAQIGLSGKSPSDFFGNLGYSQLLPLLGMPEEEREQLAEEHDLASIRHHAKFDGQCQKCCRRERRCAGQYQEPRQHLGHCGGAAGDGGAAEPDAA